MYFRKIAVPFALLTALSSFSYADYHYGKYHKGEMKQIVKDAFQKADVEKNEQLNLEEYKAFRAELDKAREAKRPSQEEEFKQIDKDGSGFVTKEEIKKHHKEMKKHHKDDDDKKDGNKKETKEGKKTYKDAK